MTNLQCSPNHQLSSTSFHTPSALGTAGHRHTPRGLLVLNLHHSPGDEEQWEFSESQSSPGISYIMVSYLGLPRWLSGKESTCQCKSHGFYPWVRKIPWRRKRQLHSSSLALRIPWTEEPGGLQSMGRKELDTTQ